MSEEHKCYIGEWLDYENSYIITLDELKEKVKNNNETFDYGLNTYGGHFMNGLMKKLNLKDYFDGRKNTNLNKFKYCPYCGKEIKWDILKKKSKGITGG